MQNFKDTDRDRALFQPVDRKYLLGEREYDIPQQESRRKRTICDRVSGGFQDLRLFQQKADEALLRKLIPDDPGEQREYRDHLVGAIALMYELHEAAGWDFEETLTRSMEEAYNWGPSKRDILPRRVVDGRAALPDTTPAPPIEEIKDRVQRKVSNGEPLTDREVRQALEYGDIETKDVLWRYIRKSKRETHRSEWAERVLNDMNNFIEDGEE